MPKKRISKQLIAEVMGYLGSIKTEKKARAVRENGKLGGRPRKTVDGSKAKA